MTEDKPIILLAIFLLALVCGVFPILAVANPSMLPGLIIGVSVSLIVGCVAVFLIARNNR